MSLGRPLIRHPEALRRLLEEKKYVEARTEYLNQARGDAEWCVNERYRDRLSITSPPCPSL